MLSKIYFLVMLLPTVVLAQSAAQQFEQRCASCHSIKELQDESLNSVWQGKGPNLSSAGVKYKADWMKQWLQSPKRIRPSGMYYGNHIVALPDGDVVDDKSLKPHMKLSAFEAENFTQYLMTMKARVDLVKKGDYQEGKISQSMGEMMFDKFRGCLACHEIEPGYGGLSGPEVYTATKRLQEDYLVSFMRKPQRWNRWTLMPDKQLKERDLQKFVHYFHALAEMEFK